MRPADLKHPFTWDERHVLLAQGVLFVPPHCNDYSAFSFPGWESPLIFGNDNPVHVEFCSGNGAWIAAKAEAHPEINWVAVEKRFDRVQRVWSKKINHQVNNLFIVCGEGFLAATEYFPKNSVQQVYVNFPDPWPKKRHAKHRIIRPEFVRLVHDLLLPGGGMMLATDDPDYSALSIEALSAEPLLHPVYPEPYFITDLPGYGTSYFEDLWRAKGRTIRYHQYQKQIVTP